jgi:hypothetical protein
MKRKGKVEESNPKFSDVAESYRPAGFFTELWDFVRHNRKWWMAPILLALLMLGILALVSATGAAPFIYSLF